MILYKLNVDLLGHKKGDMLYKVDDNFYQWNSEPKFMIEKTAIETQPDNFIKHFNEWCIGETIYFLSADGKVLCAEYHPSLHSSLVEYGNAFKHKDLVDKMKSCIVDVVKFGTYDSIVMCKDDIIQLIYLARQKDTDTIIKELNDILDI